ESHAYLVDVKIRKHQKVVDKFEIHQKKRYLVELAQRRSEYKEQMNTELPYTEWKEWKTLFIKGVFLPLPLMHCSGCIDDNDMVYAKYATMEYMNEIGDWKSPEAFGAIGKNKELGIVLAKIHTIADVSKPQQFCSLIGFDLMIACVGVPFAGKTIVAKQLEAYFGIVRVDPEMVVELAIAYAIAEDLKIKNEYVPKIVPPTPTPSYDSCTCVEMLLDPPLFSPPHEVEAKPCTTPSHLDPYHAFSLKGQLGMRAKDARDNHEP
ncbi:unnamed protein product, partial [Sphagnum compactum]